MTGDFLAVRLDDRLLGIPALRVREVVRLPVVTRIPGGPSIVAGLINLRGQIITAIDLRRRLDLPPRAVGAPAMAVVVEHEGQAYALIVDSVGDVVRASDGAQEAPPLTLSPLWCDAVLAVQRGEALVLVLDVGALLLPPKTVRAAA